MKYFIGIDGGGTKTKLLVVNEEEEVLFSSIGGPCNILSSGYDVVKESLKKAFQEGIINNGLTLDQCGGMCIGAAGGARDSVKNQIEEIVRGLGYKNELQITHDGEIALIAGAKGEAALLLIAGTGAICYGRNSKGDIVRVSGWGHIIGDEGGAYNLGVNIIRAVMQAYDGREEATVLTKLLLEAMKINNEEEIISIVYSNQSNKESIAALSMLIEEGIRIKDVVALKIADNAIDDLVQNVKPAASKLGFLDKEQRFRIILDGSVLRNNAYIRQGFIDRINSLYKNADVLIMEEDAAYGAALKILRRL